MDPFGDSSGLETGLFAVVPVLMVAMFVGFVAFAVWAIVSYFRRRNAVRAYASAHGYRYWASDPALTHRFSTHPFEDGWRRRAMDVVSGERNGLWFTTFLYVYETSSGTSTNGTSDSDTHTWQITWIGLPGALPPLAFGPDHAVMRALRLRDIDVESDEFNKRWRVTADDPAFAHAVLAPTVIEALLAPVLKGRIVFIEGDALVVAKERPSDLSDLDAVLDAVSTVRDAVPPFVFTDYATGR
ncbi:hypothetical protein [Demequina salsinemoris]|uniref:hypothetical protein n=1 Tax=Demequina salsinemoris TaxID=577470 RepID=UPI000784CCB1|nr:hypothetical protein [Demequina salsinemoris]